MPLPIPLERIADTETTLGVVFPATFKARMSRSNGGELEIDGELWWLFPFRDTTSRETIRRSSQDICHETREALERGLGFPTDGVAIAHDGAGDLLFLRREGDRLRNEVWRYELHGGELNIVVDDVARLWPRTTADHRD